MMQVADPLAVVCIFDQNLEFKEGRIFGTEITTELRDVGFKGLIFIRCQYGSHSVGIQGRLFVWLQWM